MITRNGVRRLVSLPLCSGLLNSKQEQNILEVHFVAYIIL